MGFGDCVIGEADNLTIRMKEWSFSHSLVLGKIGGWSLEFDSLMIALCALYMYILLWNPVNFVP